MKKRSCGYSLLLMCVLAVNTYGQKLGTDKLVSNGSQQLSAPDMAVAFNGWIYNAYQSGDSIAIKISKDHGSSWQLLATLHEEGCKYMPPAIVVAGTTEAQLSLFVAGIARNKTFAQNTVFVRKYDGVGGALVAEPFRESTSDPVYSCDLAGSGNAVRGDDYSVSLLYATGSASGSRIIQMVSTDGGNTFPVSNTVAASKDHYRNVSICYGKSTHASNGRFFMAWDEYSDDQAATGKVYTSRNASTVTSTAIVPVRIDNASMETAGKLSRPRIAVSTTTDNNAASCTAVILCEYTQGSRTSIAGYYNSKAHFTNTWATSYTGSIPGIQPAIAFDPVHNVFAASYYNNRDQQICLLKADFRTPLPNGWKSISANYTDNGTLSDPQPGIAIDPSSGQAALSWASAGYEHAICFDAEFNTQEPLQVSAISAVNRGSVNGISWSCSIEALSHSIFRLERSADGVRFEPLAELSVQGAPSAYHYTDAAPLNGINYYRIRIDNGSAAPHFSAIASTWSPLQQGSIVLYPNPATDHITIRLPQAPSAAAVISIYDVTGKLCREIIPDAGQMNIDITTLAAGAYSLSYQNNGRVQETLRFIKSITN